MRLVGPQARGYAGVPSRGKPVYLNYRKGRSALTFDHTTKMLEWDAIEWATAAVAVIFIVIVLVVSRWLRR